VYDWNKTRSDEWNAYLRRVRDETIILTHPCHPLCGKELSVLHYRLKSTPPSVLIELPDHSTQLIPVSWTNRAIPNVHHETTSRGAHLSGKALLELITLLESWREGGLTEGE
jgi:hypothetical protein